MKYFLIQTENSLFFNSYVFHLLKKLINLGGHALCEHPIVADFLLFSTCDITDIEQLIKVKKKYPAKKIIVGGHNAVFFKTYSLLADYINIGQGFEFFKCKTEDEFKALDCVYYAGKKKKIITSRLIEWKKLPVTQTTKRMYYYLGAVGCKNRCSFCLTSWTNKHQKNPFMKQVERKTVDIPLKIISNEDFQGSTKQLMKDMLLRDFLKAKKSNARTVKLGVEFATEKTRQKNKKFFTNIELNNAVKKALNLKINLQLFCISGIDKIEDWEKLINNLPDSYQTSPRVFLKFTNIDYNLFTPISKKINSIDESRYIQQSDIDEWFKQVAYRKKYLRFRPIKYPAYSLYRTGLQLCETMDQLGIFFKNRNNKNFSKMKKLLFESGVLNTSYENLIDLKFTQISH